MRLYIRSLSSLGCLFFSKLKEQAALGEHNRIVLPGPVAGTLSELYGSSSSGRDREALIGQKENPFLRIS